MGLLDEMPQRSFFDGANYPRGRFHLTRGRFNGSNYPRGRFKEIHIINTSHFRKSVIIAMFCRFADWNNIRRTKINEMNENKRKGGAEIFLRGV